MDINLLNEKELTSIQKTILEILNDHGDMTRDEICDTMGFDKYKFSYIQKYRKLTKYHRTLILYTKRTTIYDNLVKLEKLNLVEKFNGNNGKKGRPLIFWRIKMICDKCKKEMIGFFIFKRRYRKDLILCQDCREKRFKKRRKFSWRKIN